MQVGQKGNIRTFSILGLLKVNKIKSCNFLKIVWCTCTPQTPLNQPFIIWPWTKCSIYTRSFQNSFEKSLPKIISTIWNPKQSLGIESQISLKRKLWNLNPPPKKPHENHTVRQDLAQKGQESRDKSDQSTWIIVLKVQDIFIWHLASNFCPSCTNKGLLRLHFPWKTHIYS